MEDQMRFVLSLILAAVASNAASAQTPHKPNTTSTQLQIQADPSLSLRLAPGIAPADVSISPLDADVREVLRDISTQSGARILIGTEVSGKLTMKLEKVSVETALSVITKTVGLRYSLLTLPADLAAKLTAEQAAAIVSAADTLAASGAFGVVSGPTAVTVAPSFASAAPSRSVYLVQTKTDPAAIKAAREEARKRVADKNQTALDKAVTARMSPDAAKDPNLVKAYAAVQSLQPDQVAALVREFTTHSSPEQLNQIGEAMRRQREKDQGNTVQ
jgi:hypothetical protein